jgi:hypothetical protein
MIHVPEPGMSERLLASTLRDRIVLAAIVSLVPASKTVVLSYMNRPFGRGME